MSFSLTTNAKPSWGFWQITNTLTEPEVAFTGDTMSDFIIDANNADVLRAKVLVLEVIYFVQCFLGYELMIFKSICT
jgi:hypothetical protein